MPLIYKDIDYSYCRRGWGKIELDDGETLLWPRCEISNCEAYICVGMSKSLCYPHGIEFGAFTEAEVEENRAKK
jgi:hypothetical protein